MLDDQVERLLTALDGVRRNGTGWSARCPAHPDRNPSLTVAVNGDKILVHCHAGCDVADILHAVGLSERDLFAPREPRGHDERRRRIVATYDYTVDGELRFQVVRFDPKDFRQRRPDGRGGWVWDLHGVAPSLYHHDQVAAAVADQLPVVICEGEKDVHAVEAAGWAAMCNPMGAGKWDTVAAQARQLLAGAAVVVIADADRPGRAHARHVVASLRDVTASIGLLEPMPGFKDVAEHLGAGHTLDDLVDIDIDTPADEEPDDDTTGGPDVFTRQEVTIMVVEPEEVHWIWQGRLPLGKLVVLDGDPSVGKSTLALDLAARISQGRAMPMDPIAIIGPSDVILLSAEDGIADTIRPRLDRAGADTSRIHALLSIVVRRNDTVTERPFLLPDDIGELERMVVHHGARLVIIDVLFAYLSGDTNSYRDQDVRAALAPLAAMADRCRCCVLVLRHLRKSSTGSALYAGGGSIGIVGASRLALIASYDPDDRDVADLNDRRRVLAVTKSNLARTAPALSYRIVDDGGVGRIEWLGAVEHTADALVDPSPRDEERADKEAFLADLLADGPVLQADVESAAKRHGWTIKALRTTLRKLGGESRPTGKGEPWAWSIPDPT